MTENIHIRIGYPEALEGKREILNSEKELLQTIKNIKSFSLLRKKEFTLKTELKKDLGELKTIVKKIEDELPKDKELQIEKPSKTKEMTQEETEEEFEKQERKATKKASRTSKKSALDAEIQDIQDKLARLG